MFLNFYVIYRTTVICKSSLHIFGNLIAHWLLASQGSFTPDARVSLGVFFVLEWVLNVCMWLLAQGTPQWRINHRNGQEDSYIYPKKTLSTFQYKFKGDLKMSAIFTRGPFGLRVLSSPVSVCVCVSVCLSTFACPDDNSSHVPARITWFGRKDAKHFALGPYCFGG